MPPQSSEPYGGTDWVRAEHKAANALGLRMTLLSGSVFHDPGDSANYAQDGVRHPLVVDSKATQKKSYSLNRDFLRSYRERITMHGKIPALHVQFQQESKPDEDWLAVPLADFADLLESANKTVEIVAAGLTEEQVKALDFLEELADKIKDPALRSETYEAIVKLRG